MGKAGMLLKLTSQHYVCKTARNVKKKEKKKLMNDPVTTSSSAIPLATENHPFSPSAHTATQNPRALRTLFHSILRGPGTNDKK